MKKTVLGLLVALSGISAMAQNHPPTANKKKDGKPMEEVQKRIASVMSYRVSVKDTNSLQTIAASYTSMADYNSATANNFMTTPSYQKFGESLGKIVPIEMLVVNEQFNPMSEREITNSWKGEKSEEDDRTAFTSNDITGIRFYEEWKIDPVTLDMSKKVLGYSVLVMNPSQSKKEKTLFTIVKDDVALQKLKENFKHL